MTDDSRAIRLTFSIASQRSINDNVMLLTSSDGVETWHVPPQEIYLTIDDIKRLYDMVKEI